MQRMALVILGTILFLISLLIGIFMIIDLFNSIDVKIVMDENSYILILFFCALVFNLLNERSKDK